MDTIKVVVLEQESEVRIELEDILLSIEYIVLTSIVETANELYDILENNRIDVILISSSIEGDGYVISEKLSMEYPELVIIIIEEQLQEATMHKAFFAGAKDVLIKPIRPAHLIDSIYKANQLTKKKALIQKDTLVKAKKNSSRGKVFTVFSTKGGVGKTFIATNLALTLAKKNRGKRVVLVDLDLDFGNIALALNILPRFTISDVVDDIRNIDQDYIESYLTIYESLLWVLPANIHPMKSEFMNAQHIDIILRTLQNAFDYIVIDMPGRFQETINPAFAIADLLLLVVTPEISSVRNIKASLITLNELNYPKSKIRVILNRTNGHEIKNKDIETTLNFNIFASLKEDYKHVISSMNIGVPYVMANSYRQLTKDFKKMVKKIVEPYSIK